MRPYYASLVSWIFLRVIFCAPVIAGTPARPFSDTTTHHLHSASFDVSFDQHGLTSLRKAGDRFPTDYIRKGEAFGDFYLESKTAGSTYGKALHAQERLSLQVGDNGTMRYNEAAPNAGLKVSTQFNLTDDALVYKLTIDNKTQQKMELGSLCLPVNYNSLSGEDPKGIFEESVIKHHFISGNGSYIFWERPTGVGPYLVMTPLPGTHLEYYDLARTDSGDTYFRVFIHAKADTSSASGTWRQPQTAGVLKAAASVTYGFKFRWAKDYQEIRDILFQEGLPDINIVPGMTVPNDLFAQFSIRCKQKINAIEAEFPSSTKIIDQGARADGNHLYKVQFSRNGENRLTVKYGNGLKTYLEFFSTEPLATLYKKRASFLVTHQQYKVPGKWYDGVFGPWDMSQQELRGPDNPDSFTGRLSYVLTCDDPGLCKAPFLAAKNLHYPDQSEIDAIEYYIKNFVWGKLQRTDQEAPYPYGVYGTPSWYVDRDPEKRKLIATQYLDKVHVWRSYDYPHIMMLYFHLYQIATVHPQMTHFRDKAGYLKLAMETAKAYFKYPYEILPWYETYKWGCYNELLIVDLMAALKKEGFAADADWLRKEWEKKVKYFIYDDPYPFRSEYSIDATAFESSHAFAQYGINNAMQPDSNLWYDKKLERWYSHPHVEKKDAEDFMERQMQANIACRGWLENAYYLKGSDFRGSSDHYLLSYMAQMGGWAVVDYALNYSKDAPAYLQLGYASYLSSFALMNTGTAKSNYGAWYPGKMNDGASGWAFEPLRKNKTWINRTQNRGPWFYDGEIDLGYGGALRTARTIVTVDPVFGLLAYGGLISSTGDTYVVSPRDGVQQRFSYIYAGKRLNVELESDGFCDNRSIVFNTSLNALTLKLKTRTDDVHNENIQIEGLSEGAYKVLLNGKPLHNFEMQHTSSSVLHFNIPASGTYTLQLQKI